MPATDILVPPFVLEENEEKRQDLIELMFFERIEDILSDKHDILWDDKYSGCDSLGRGFCVVSASQKKGLLSAFRNDWVKNITDIEEQITNYDTIRSRAIRYIEKVAGNNVLLDQILAGRELDMCDLASLIKIGIELKL